MTTAERVSDERLAELVMATDMRGRYESAEYCKRIDDDTSAALRELAQRRSAESANGQWIPWKRGDALPPEGVYYTAWDFERMKKFHDSDHGKCHTANFVACGVRAYYLYPGASPRSTPPPFEQEDGKP